MSEIEFLDWSRLVGTQIQLQILKHYPRMLILINRIFVKKQRSKYWVDIKKITDCPTRFSENFFTHIKWTKLIEWHMTQFSSEIPSLYMKGENPISSSMVMDWWAKPKWQTEVSKTQAPNTVFIRVNIFSTLTFLSLHQSNVLPMTDLRIWKIFHKKRS